MEGPRPLFENELGELVQFLTQHLRQGSPWTIADEYPLAITNGNLNNVRVIRDNKDFFIGRGDEAARDQNASCVFKMAAIGSVVTNPLHRNQGLSQAVLEDCNRWRSQHGCDFAILWTNLHDFYRKLGFELAGTEISMNVPAEL